MTNRYLEAALTACLVTAASATAGEGHSVARVVLRWRPVGDAVAYEVQIARDTAFTQMVISEKVKDATYRWNDLPAQTHWWRVRSVDAEGRPGRWTEPRSIEAVLVSPEPVAPPPGARLTYDGDQRTLELSVIPSRVIKEYRFEVARDAEFGSRVAEVRAESPVTHVPLPGLGTFWWRCGALSLSGQELAPGAPRSFTVSLGPTRVTEPAEGALIAPARLEPITLSWLPLRPVAHWRVEVASGDRVVWRTETKAASAAFTPPGPGTFACIVTAIDADGNKAPSRPSHFTVGIAPPALLQPVAGSAFAFRAHPPPVVLAWTTPWGAARYSVEVARDAEFSTAAVRADVPTPLWTTPALDPGTYYWRVAARDARGNASAPSPPATFTLNRLPPLPPPRPMTPADGAVLDRNENAPGVGFAWKPVTDAVAYEIEVDGAPAISTRDPSVAVPGLGPGAHAWRVRALADGPAPGDWGAATHFFYGRPATVRSEIQPASATLVAGSGSTDVVIRLYDDRGRPVRGASLSATASSGSVSGVREAGAGYHARYVAPDVAPTDGQVSLTIVDRDYSATTQLRVVTKPDWLRLGARVGWESDLAGVSSLYGGAEAGLRTPLLSRRLLVYVRAGYHEASTSIPSQPGLAQPISAKAQMLGTSLLLAYELPWRSVRLGVGLGPSIQFTRISVGNDLASAAVPGGEAFVGAAYGAGPGEVFLDVTGALGSLHDSIATLRTGGLLVSAGYRFLL